MTKTYDNLQEPNFFIEAFFDHFQLDPSVNVGEIYLYVTQDMSPGLIREISANKIMEGFFLELNLRNKTEFLIV